MEPKGVILNSIEKSLVGLFFKETYFFIKPTFSFSPYEAGIFLLKIVIFLYNKKCFFVKYINCIKNSNLLFTPNFFFKWHPLSEKSSFCITCGTFFPSGTIFKSHAKKRAKKFYF